MSKTSLLTLFFLSSLFSEQTTCPSCLAELCCPKRPEMNLPCAYNAPARIEVSPCSTWDLFFSASFLYWQPIQDNMELAASLKTKAGHEFFETTPGNSTESHFVSDDFTYKPGFKTLIGMNLGRDHWDLYAEYTWFRNTTISKTSRSDTDDSNLGLTPARGNPLLLQTIANGGPGDAAAVFDRAHQTWMLNVQSLDLALIRPCYKGENLLLKTLFGAKVAWFTQTDKEKFVDSSKLSEEGPPGTYTMKQNFSSWGIGLLTGLKSQWLLGKGWNLMGDGSVDLLYTRVGSSNTRFEWTEETTLPVIYKFSDNRPDFLMPHMELEFGFGWGTYFDCYNWHADLSAAYGFQVFWGANLFRSFTGKGPSMSQAPGGNLYIHGLNLSGRLDF